MLKKSDGSIHAGKIMAAKHRFEEALESGNFEKNPELLHITSGLLSMTEFMLDNKEHYENTEKILDKINYNNTHASEIKEELNKLNSTVIEATETLIKHFNYIDDKINNLRLDLDEIKDKFNE